jgi:hypothetical protein
MDAVRRRREGPRTSSRPPENERNRNLFIDWHGRRRYAKEEEEEAAAGRGKGKGRRRWPRRTACSQTQGRQLKTRVGVGWTHRTDRRTDTVEGINISLSLTLDVTR